MFGLHTDLQSKLWLYAWHPISSAHMGYACELLFQILVSNPGVWHIDGPPRAISKGQPPPAWTGFL